MRRSWRREEVQESQGPRVPRYKGPKVPGSQGLGYLKLTFKYELDTKEGPSCQILIIANMFKYPFFMIEVLVLLLMYTF